MNEVFRGALEAPSTPIDAEKSAGDDYEVRFKPNLCFEGVLKDLDFLIIFLIFFLIYAPMSSLLTW